MFSLFAFILLTQNYCDSTANSSAHSVCTRCGHGQMKRLKEQIFGKEVAIRNYLGVIKIKNAKIEELTLQINESQSDLIHKLRLENRMKEEELQHIRYAQKQNDQRVEFLRKQLFARCALYHKNVDLSIHAQIAMMSQEMETSEQEKQMLFQRVSDLEHDLVAAQNNNATQFAVRLQQTEQELVVMQQWMNEFMSTNTRQSTQIMISPPFSSEHGHATPRVPWQGRPSHRNHRKRGKPPSMTPSAPWRIQ